MTQEQPKCELIYWGIRGLGAICRVALVYSGVPFKDSRTTKKNVLRRGERAPCAHRG